MLQFVCPYSFSGVPYIMNESLDDYAVDLLQDAIPSVLSKPQPVDVEWLMEYYLKLYVAYKKLSYDKKVLGMTAFNSGYVQVFDEASGKPKPLLVDAGTVIIDSSLLIKRNEHRMRFTEMHEGSHWLLHQKAFAKDNFFTMHNKYENQYLAAKEGRLDYTRNVRVRTDSDRIERQADFLASTLLMPKPTLRMAFVNFFKHYYAKPRAIVRGMNDEQNAYAEMLPTYVSQVFNVSKRAAMIRLEKLGAIVNKPV